MTNKEYYGDFLQIVKSNNYANIYYRKDNIMYLLVNLNSTNIMEDIENWLNEECSYSALYKYEELK